MQVSEQSIGAREREALGPVQEVTLEQRSQPGPVGRQRRVPIVPQGCGESLERGARIVDEHPSRVGHVPVRIHQPDLVPNDVVGRGEDPAELLFEVRVRAFGRRRDEVHAISVGVGEQGAQGLEVRFAHRSSSLIDPRQVEDVLPGVGQRLDALDRLPDRAEGESSLGEVLRRQMDPDHAYDPFPKSRRF